MSERARSILNSLSEFNLSRRQALTATAAGVAGVATLGLTRSAHAHPCNRTVSQTQGPYWVDELLNRQDIRPDPTTGVLQAGIPLRLAINVSEWTNGVCTPVPDCWVDIWHCNATGAYSDVAAGGGNPNTQGQKWLRGYQVADAHGNARFLTIYPGWYAGRTVHIHFRIRKFSGTTTTFNFTSQMYFDDAISNSIFSRATPYNTHTGRTPATNSADSLYSAANLLRMADRGDHVVASFNAVIDSINGLANKNCTPPDEDSMDHMHDFGGGTPRLA